MSDHARLAALRRITVKRGATKAEAATAKRLADALEAKVGEGRTRRSRRKAKMALPEPPAERKRRVWGIRLDLAYEKTCWIYPVVLALFLVLSAPLAVMILGALLGLDRTPATEGWIMQLMFYKYVVLGMVAAFTMVIGGSIALASIPRTTLLPQGRPLSLRGT